MQQSESLDKLAAALAKAQSTLDHASKDSSNPFFKSKYADLTACIDASRPHLSENGLSVSQFPTACEREGYCALVTTLLHSSGQFISGTMEMKPVKTDPQAIGSCLTYLRRYALAAVVGLGQVDDDGNSASRKSVGKEEISAHDKVKILALLEKHAPDKIEANGPPYSWTVATWKKAQKFTSTIKDK
jgi:hypothetical protein